jgi:DNA-binding MurR/RpiR family transcriptional regulator
MVTQRMIDFFHFSGKEEAIIEQMEELADIGVKTISMTTYTLINKVDMVKEVGSKIVKHFQY